MTNIAIRPGNETLAGAAPECPAGYSCGALGLGVDVGVLPTMAAPDGVLEAMPQAGVPTPPKTDRFDKGESRDRREAGRDRALSSASGQRAKEAASSPFATLVQELRVLPAPLRVAATALSLEKAMELPVESAACLAALQTQLPSEKNVACDRVNLGFALTAADAQDAERAHLGALASGHASVASKVFSHNIKRADEDFAAWLKTNVSQLGIVRADVNALVQLVLREAYLIGNDQLRDYAEKVKFFNDMKKKIREQLIKARETKAQWAELQAALSPGATFIADPPFTATDVNTSTGELYIPSATEEDVAAHEALLTKKGSGAGAGTVGTYEALFGESRLSNSDFNLLETVIEDKDSGILDKVDSEDDDFIKNNLDEIKAVISRMNAAELRKYFPQIIAILSGGNADEEAIIALYKSLTPAQCAFVLAQGVGPNEVDGLSGSEQATVDMHLTGGVARLADEHGVKLDGPVTREQAAQLLAGLQPDAEHQTQETDAAADTGPIVGSEKCLYTPEEMDAYIKGLEDKLNIAGDDAQLANVDLQNQLQKQQQLLQTMSNISKMLHDTAMAIIRKSGS